jgi:membrane protein
VTTRPPARARTDPYRSRPARDGASPAAHDRAAPAHAASPDRPDPSAGNVGILAGGIAYFGFMATFPALNAGISLYGLVDDLATLIAQQGGGLLGVLPLAAQPLIRDQLNALASGSGGR